MNTPIAKSGTNMLTFPSVTMMSTAAVIASASTPLTVDAGGRTSGQPVGQVVVGSDHLHQLGQTAERRVGGQRQQHQGGGLDDVVQEPTAEDPLGDLREHCLSVARRDMQGD